METNKSKDVKSSSEKVKTVSNKTLSRSKRKNRQISDHTINVQKEQQKVKMVQCGKTTKNHSAERFNEKMNRKPINDLPPSDVNVKRMSIGGVNKYDMEVAKETQATTTNSERPIRSGRNTNTDLLVAGPGILNRAQEATRTLTGFPVIRHIIPRLTTLKEQEEIRARAEKNPRITSRQKQLLQLLQEPFNQMSVVTKFIGLTGSGGLVAERFAQMPHPVRCVMNVTYELPLLKMNGIESYRIPVEDDQRENLFIYFDEVTAKINEHEMQGYATVVHCMAGVSRSATFVIAYLIRYHQMSLEQAFRLTKSSRSIVNPNIGFLHQLAKYESETLLDKGKCTIWREHTLNGITKQFPEFVIADYIQDYQNEFDDPDND